MGRGERHAHQESSTAQNILSTKEIGSTAWGCRWRALSYLEETLSKAGRFWT
jgi:hypothetical protein